MKTFKELREQSGMNMKRFAEYFGIPYRTVQNWEAGVNKCPDYLLNLMKFRLDQEGIGSTEIIDGECTKCGWFGDCVEARNHKYCPGCGRPVKKG